MINRSTAGFQAGNDLVIGLGAGVVAATNADIVTLIKLLDALLLHLNGWE